MGNGNIDTQTKSHAKNLYLHLLHTVSIDALYNGYTAWSVYDTTVTHTLYTTVTHTL